MSGHTPGPWRASTAVMDGFNPVMGPGGVIVSLVSTLSGRRMDARLITTAPDGLTLAQSILADCTDTTPVEWIEMARGIVAKAEGV